MGKSPARAMAMHGKSDDGQIAGARGISNVGQVNGVHEECDQNNNHPMMILPVLTVSTLPYQVYEQTDVRTTEPLAVIDPRQRPS